MEFSLKEDLERFGRMAFVRAADCAQLIKRFHGLVRRKGKEKTRPSSMIPLPHKAPDPGPLPIGWGEGETDYSLLEKVYGWVCVPVSVWAVDVMGLCGHVVACV